MSLEAHAGCLSFEFSSPKQSLIVVNCGISANTRAEWRPVARATAAHSTVTFNDVSSAQFVEAGVFRNLLGGSPMLGGPSQVRVSREEQPDGTLIRASHDGYAERFGIIHERTVTLTADGTQIRRRGFIPRRRRQRANPHRAGPLCGRFHLHPTVKATRLTDGHGVLLMTAHHEAWTFSAGEDQVRDRGQCLSRQQRKPAPHRATRYPRPCPFGAGVRWQLPARQARPRLRPPATSAARARRSHACRCDGTLAPARAHPPRSGCVAGEDDKHDTP